LLVVVNRLLLLECDRQPHPLAALRGSYQFWLNFSKLPNSMV
jgi:hypothetical protein